VGETHRDTETPQYCDACFTGEYPVRLVDHENHRSEDTVTYLAGRRGKR
jgi:amidophosphoribosyltransferase